MVITCAVFLFYRNLVFFMRILDEAVSLVKIPLATRRSDINGGLNIVTTQPNFNLT